MAFPRSFFWVPIWATGFFVAVGSVWAAEDAKPPSPPNPRAAVERALDKTLAFDLTETALDDVVDWLRSELKISIHVDRRSLDNIGIGGETPITFHVSAIPVRNALDLLLEELDLTWLIHDNVLVITSVETAEATLETKTYDVADLVVLHDGKDRLIVDYDSMIEMITTMVLPSSWDEVGGRGSIAPYDIEGKYALVVLQTREAHERIAALLAALRDLRKETKARKSKPPWTVAEWAEHSKGVRLLQTPKERAILRTLQKPISVDFEDAPLADVMKYFGKQLGVPTHVGIRYLNDVGMGMDTPVTCSLHNVPARMALDCILHEVDLTWIVRNDVLYVTTIENAEVRCEIEIYDVADLVRRHDASDRPIVGEDFDSLIELITSTIDPTTWDEVGGPGSIACFHADGIDVLLFVQTQVVHEKTSLLLSKLREVREHTKDAKKAPSPEETILAALKKRVSLDLSEAPLIDVLRCFPDKLGVQILLDRRALADLGLEGTEPVTLRASDLQGQTCLELLLRQYNLDWTVLDKVIVVTSAEEAERRLVTRVYDIADLVQPPPEEPAGQSAVLGRDILAQFDPRFQDAPMHVRFEDPYPGSARDSLIEVITSTISPETWDTVGGPGSIVPYEADGIDVLVIAQTWPVHQKIEALLASLRAMPRKKFATRPIRGAFRGGAITAPPPALDQLGVDPRRDAVTAANNTFGFDLYAKLREHSKDNLFFSPYSLSTALAMAYCGARGKTAEEMAGALHLKMSQEQVAPAYHSLEEAVRLEHGCELNVANRLWGDRGQTFLDAYLTLLRGQFKADLVAVDFTQGDETAARINKWVAHATKNKIPQLVDAGMFSPDTRMVLTNAMYFNGKWTARFDPKDTMLQTFHSPAGQIQVKMMYQRGHAYYTRQDGIQILEKPYGNGALAMMILLPGQSPEAMEALEKSLTPEKLKAWASQTAWRQVDLYLPRFKMEQFCTLGDVLESLGMNLARNWHPGKTDLSGISGDKNLYLDAVIHKALVEVEEEGTVAAAATAVMGGFGGGAQFPSAIPVFHADHPFVFLIRDTRTGAILFLGRLVRPEGKYLSRGMGGGMF